MIWCTSANPWLRFFDFLQDFDYLDVFRCFFTSLLDTHLGYRFKVLQMGGLKLDICSGLLMPRPDPLVRFSEICLCIPLLICSVFFARVSYSYH